MTILVNLQNSRKFPPGILGTVDSREFPFPVALVRVKYFHAKHSFHRAATQDILIQLSARLRIFFSILRYINVHITLHYITLHYITLHFRSSVHTVVVGPTGCGKTKKRYGVLSKNKIHDSTSTQVIWYCYGECKLMLGECLQVDFQGLRANFHDSDSCLMLD